MLPQADAGFTDVWGTSTNDVWVLGDNNNLWRYNGVQWTQSMFPANTNPIDIHGLAPNDMWVAGPLGVHRWNGMTWTNTGLGIAAEVVYVRGPNDVLALPDVLPDNPNYETVAHWDGFQWTIHELPIRPTMFGRAGGTMYFGASSGGLLYQQ